ncbi:HEAT repeat domain-containing protein [Synechococcus sp. PROS-U-1]|uniref:HEAT repeat domain-containing protein n=1 Tax=Synechococcus sp. PROS-U-1 TaxID=1400866 RepID=UPI00164732E0|nr:HEAT repeat domain-containing protein [Synechococcus sp. PROS-U-1]QNJ02171.1 phycoerythrobilin:Cys-82 alpha-phycoerythrin lyase/ CpeZ subunit [Synechococcus sp. PROS-U-1]
MSDDSIIPSIEALFEDLMHPNPRIQEEACLILSEHYQKEAMPKLLELFCHHDPKVYRAAVKGIGFFGSSAFDPLIELYATTENQTARRCCPKAFVQLFKNFPDQPFPDSVMEMLEQGIDDTDMVVVQGALMCLGQIGKQQFKSQEAIRLLARSLSSENVALIFSASQALADIPNPMAEDALHKLQENNDDPLIQEAAQSALARLQNLLNSRN